MNQGGKIMRKPKASLSITCAAAFVAALVSGSAVAQKGYPTKPVRFVSPFSPGGSTDILARLVGQQMNKLWSSPVIVENRPGAGGNIGAEVVAKAPPDGHVLLLSASSVAINPSLYSRMAFDTGKDLAPVGLVGTVPNILVVHPSVPVTTVKQLIALARKTPGALTYASGGSGTGSQLIAELFQHDTKVRFTHIPYKGSGPATTALLSGEAALAFNNMLAAKPHVESGRMRAIAVTSAARSAFLPNVPTIAESGVPGFEADSWYGVFTTGGSPREVVDTLSSTLNQILHMPDVRKRLDGLGVTPRKMTPPEFGAFVGAEMKKWEAVVKLSKAKVE